MKLLFTSACKPLPIFLNRFLSIDDVAYRFIVDQGPFSATADVPCFSLHFLAQNIQAPSTVLEWPTIEELEAELRSTTYDYVCISFKVIDANIVAKMITHIREASPSTKIILGGYGTLALNEPEYTSLRDAVDVICWSGDGVRFLRKLLGEPIERTVQAHLPVETIRIKWLERMGQMTTSVGYLLSALGCVWKCEFCCTSAYTNGQTVDVMTPEEIVESAKWYYRNHPSVKHIFVMDEEILLRKKKVEAIGKLIRDDQEFGLGKLSLLAFGTIKALSRWDPEELLLNGIGEFWTGVESKFSYQRKKGEIDQKELIRNVQEHGIEAQLSWIMGDDCQTKENIEEDINDLIEFKPCTVQLTTLAAFPGTPLYRRLKAEGRVPPLNPEEFHLFGNTLSSLHFTHDERVKIILDTYNRIYEVEGPSAMRSMNVHMNGYEYCARSKNPFLNGPKKEYFKAKVVYTIFLIRVAIEYAPTERARKAMEDLHHRYVSIFGPMRKSQQFLAERALRLCEKEMERRSREGYTTLRDVPMKKYLYKGAGESELLTPVNAMA